MRISSRDTARLRLRSWVLADVDPLCQIMNQPAILQYFPNNAPPDLEKTKRLVNFQLSHWEDHGYGWWAVQEKDRSHLIGWCGLQYLPDTDEIEIGYLLDKNYWGKGLATEASNSGLEFGFSELGIHEIVGIVHPENNASIRVLEKLGMIYSRRESYFGMDCLRYSLTDNKFHPNT